ncbi:nicotinate-nucleotide--dimethylbenzimidazole phosphoribosyltransferase [uncultured Clostridium sp.]|uniref:nicotinate-nucleotide--dimethylbenzimidazole phosphoribosyltransferase n=1 Tax=uncultured Clostridium sp. TaxID=59620 RepID=UPI0025F11D37|nr:nicotinate-nucleotide--dimethylbenzimidazole phosphoribosyltransferase [uncultured Clostridium sp.]
MKLKEAIKSINYLDKKYLDESTKRWDSIAKPLKSLGLLEEAVIKIAGITGCSRVSLDKKALIIMCADNGVVEEGVTQTGQEVTANVTENFTDEKATVSIMSKSIGVDVFPVDIGIYRDMDGALNEDEEIQSFHILNRKIAYGTDNMLKGPAMTRENAVKAIETGISLVKHMKNCRYNIVATGEMGIGNTTTSSAIASVLLNQPVENVTGKGAGLTSDGLNRKIHVIKESIKLNVPDVSDPIDVLAKVGGYDIAGLVGVFIGGAVYNIPIVIDGFISAVAALVASRIEHKTIQYMIPSHVSKEPAGKMLLNALGLKPFITCEMCLGEGSGAVALFPILDMACTVYNKMSSFNDIGIEEYKPLS